PRRLLPPPHRPAQHGSRVQDAGGAPARLFHRPCAVCAADRHRAQHAKGRKDCQV
ncbi:hypothetical protein IWQ56_001210, partial [Coemansia nantahalensis]